MTVTATDYQTCSWISKYKIVSMKRTGLLHQHNSKGF